MGGAKSEERSEGEGEGLGEERRAGSEGQRQMRNEDLSEELGEGEGEGRNEDLDEDLGEGEGRVYSLSEIRAMAERMGAELRAEMRAEGRTAGMWDSSPRAWGGV